MTITGINDLWALILATLVFLAIPGPGTIKLLASVGEPGGGVRAGLWSTLGLLSGDSVWMVLALGGVAAFAAAHPAAFDVLRYGGAAYLAWVGWRLLRDARVSLGERPGGAAARGRRGPRAWFLESMLVSLSNPKVIGFYVAFFPLFIDPRSFDGVATYARMMAIVLVLAFLYCLWLIAAAQFARRVFALYPELPVWLKRLGGAALMGFAGKFAAER
ncbi:MAG: LysE family translocator [Casimicrobiaceae bacterium]|nr:LysE family translocator [Casimicrobiaceae bacterium]MCX8099004.1 LysE family translocator [Casimicrobiaceae bacterium]MDW8311468.1 LysE family translocator [Burkholderiales bacterium]